MQDFYRFFFVFLKMALNFVCNHLCLFQSGACRQNHLTKKDPLIFIRNITLGHPQEKESHRRHNQQENDYVAAFPGKGMTDQFHIPVPDPVKYTIEAKEKRFRNTAESSHGSCPHSTGFSSVAQSTGVRIKATTTDNNMEAIMVTENWR